MFQRVKKQIISFMMTTMMVVTMFPVTTSATGNDQVYITVSEEGQFITDATGQAMANRGVSLEDLSGIDLDEYGLSDYKYDADGDGKYDVTALHLYIYVHEQILGLDWSLVDCSNGSPGSMYFTAGLFGYGDENLRYNYNGAYPADENGWGFTVDRIVLQSGDFFDVAHFSDWMFYSDSAYGFNYFTDLSGNVINDYTIEAGNELSVQLQRISGGMGMEEMIIPQADYTVYFGESIGNEMGTVVTDSDGQATFTFTSPGTYYLWCSGGEGIDMAAGAIVSTPASAKVTVTDGTAAPAPEVPRVAQDVSAVLDATMAELATTVTAPAFGTNAGEWTVLGLARGGYFEKDNKYFTDYYSRIVEKVNETAASVNLQNGALHKNKSTDNSRLIVALSSIGKNATMVGDWNLIAPYEDFDWIKKQGINGAIWALIALDSNNYATIDTTIRKQCVDYILSLELSEGGWALSGTELDADITGMALQALYPYRTDSNVAEASERAFARLSELQQESGGYKYGKGETSESAAQVIVACTTWGINPDTDARFVKDGKSVVDALLAYYVENRAMFEHQIGAGVNNMATDQCCYALVAYDRMLNHQNALYDYTDVVFDEIAGDMAVSLGVPKNVKGEAGTTFNAVIGVNKWDNAAGYKMMDFILSVPAELEVTGVTSGANLRGGEVSYHLDGNKLRVVYFDPNTNNDLTMSGASFPAELFTIQFQVKQTISTNQSGLLISVDGMSLKTSSDATDENAMFVVNTQKAYGVISIVPGVTYSATCLYTGDDVDLIPSSKKAVAVAVTGIEGNQGLQYNDGTNSIAFQYSAEITAKTGVVSYVALVDANIAMESFIRPEYFTLTCENSATITFGDSNDDGIINAQDALSAVDCWLRKTSVTSDMQILALNVNGDSRLNTFDALGIVEAFVNNSEFGVVTKAATLAQIAR